jgi:pilus assembly protein CpaE
LVDADPAHADLTAALGIVPDDNVRTILDLVPVMDELSPDHLNDVLYQHPRGFSALLGPPEPVEIVRPGLYRGAVALLALDYDTVVLHVARPAEISVRDVVALADAVVLVTTLDLVSIYGARRVMASLASANRETKWLPVVNRAARSPLSPKDVERALGVPPATRIRQDSRVRRAQERGRLLPVRSRGAGRDIRRLGELLISAAMELESSKLGA